MNKPSVVVAIASSDLAAEEAAKLLRLYLHVSYRLLYLDTCKIGNGTVLCSLRF